MCVCVCVCVCVSQVRFRVEGLGSRFRVFRCVSKLGMVCVYAYSGMVCVCVCIPDMRPNLT